MRRLILGIVLALCLPASAQAGVRVSAFFYPWYGTVAHDGAYRHWSQHGHDPPNDIASSYYPARGLYSSADQLVMAQQMDEIRSAGIDEIVVSWWGQGSPEDQVLPAVIVAARADGIAVAVHLEPYGGRTVASTVADIALPAQLRHHVVLRLPPVRSRGQRLGGCEERAARRRRAPLRADGDGRRRGESRLRRRLHLRHRHVRRQHVPSAVCPGTRACT